MFYFVRMNDGDEFDVTSKTGLAGVLEEIEHQTGGTEGIKELTMLAGRVSDLNPSMLQLCYELKGMVGALTGIIDNGFIEADKQTALADVPNLSGMLVKKARHLEALANMVQELPIHDLSHKDA